MTTATLVLKPGKDKAILHGHPWIFSGAVAHEPAKAPVGSTVIVQNDAGQSIALAAYSPRSQIRARVWSHSVDRPIDHAFFKRRVAEAIAQRRAQITGFDALGGVRLVHGESDALPGVTCDRYQGAQGQWLVLQLTSAGADRWRDAIVDALVAETGIDNVYERSDSDVRALEGLAQKTGVLRGLSPPNEFVIDEGGMQLRIDIVHGHKTGFYLDQRDNRARVRTLAPGARVLNAFCYTGGFSIAALRAGASAVVSIDSSADALELARQNIVLNRLEAADADWICADVFTTLRQLRADRRAFDAIVLDPPKLAPSISHLDRAARAYKDLNMQGLRLLAPAGRLLTYSCSGVVSAELFQKIIAGAAADADVDVVIESRLGAGLDHPVRLAFPEGDYLKGLLLRRRASQ